MYARPILTQNPNWFRPVARSRSKHRSEPWQNPYVERVIGSIRRECTDHIITLGERHLLQTLLRYKTYYNEFRCHLSLESNAPKPRRIEDGLGEVVATPHLGGLHHRYSRAA